MRKKDENSAGCVFDHDGSLAQVGRTTSHNKIRNLYRVFIAVVMQSPAGE